ncbi:Holliday junction ATP-dependent DNA helicase RuvA [Alphaproteobacteria bacterium SO-S41]|nr:Holliday junction ATP-dependent DNA helicase RuvA [Alphaproteobacteria bacterium SO-S41]
MIGKLSGKVDEIAADHAIVDVHGVGYVAYCPSRTLDQLTRGEAAVLFIETVVREDMIRLFGFLSGAERDWFRLLQTVQGVGAKVALAILSTLPGDALAQAIAMKDKAAVARTPGVGPKLAERLISELKDKAPAAIISGVPAAAIAAISRAPQGPAAEAVSALVNLGYGQSEAGAAVAAAVGDLGSDATLDKLIRDGLKRLAR